MDQQEHDRRSLAWHRLVVQHMQGNPALLERSRITLARWMAGGPAPNRLYLAEWKAALDKGIGALTSSPPKRCALWMEIPGEAQSRDGSCQRRSYRRTLSR